MMKEAAATVNQAKSGTEKVQDIIEAMHGFTMLS